jgi:hypothetical protein
MYYSLAGRADNLFSNVGARKEPSSSRVEQERASKEVFGYA